MKELEKTKNISIASVLFILAIIIALLAYKKPKFSYQIDSKAMLEKVSETSNFVSLDEITDDSFVLVDIRDRYEFNKGSLENAVNMPFPELLTDENTALLNQWQTENKTVVLFGQNTTDVSTPFMLLHQIGYTNLKMATISISYSQNQVITKNVVVEENAHKIADFIAESVKKVAEAAAKPAPPAPKPVKTVVPVVKKKKMPVEGGC